MAGEEIARIPFKIKVEAVGTAEGEFIRFLAPRTVDALLRLLPLGGRVALYGEQVYFQVPLRMGPEKGVATVAEGDVAYWPLGGALCLFKSAMQPHGSVSLVGKVTSGLDILNKVKSGTPIKIDRAESSGQEAMRAL